MTVQDEKRSSLAEVAKDLSVSKDTIRNWTRKESAPAHKAGHPWKSKFSEIDE